MSLKSFLIVAAWAGSACAGPVFVPSSYNAWIGKSTLPGPLTPVVSSTDINNTDLSAPSVFYTNIWHITQPTDRLVIQADFVFFTNTGLSGRGGSISMLFTPSTDATFTFSGSATQNQSSSSSAYGTLLEGANLLLFGSTGAPQSVQIYAGHQYQLDFQASVYGSLESASASVELTEPTPAPAGTLVLTAAGLLASARRRRT